MTINRYEDKQFIVLASWQVNQAKYLYYPARVFLSLLLCTYFKCVAQHHTALHLYTLAFSTAALVATVVGLTMTFTPISVGDYAPDCHKLIPYSQVTLKLITALYLVPGVL